MAAVPTGIGLGHAHEGGVFHARVVVCHTARSPLRDEGTLTRREHPRGAASALEAQKGPRWGRESRRPRDRHRLEKARDTWRQTQGRPWAGRGGHLSR